MSREPLSPLPQLSQSSLHEASLAGKVINSVEFARDGRRLTGRIAVTEMARLHDVVHMDAGQVSVEVVGELDADRKHWLHVAIQGELAVTCQRCLQPLVQRLEIDSHLRVIRPGEPWPEDELSANLNASAAEEEGSDIEPDDAIEADEALELLALVEEEIILVLPYAPTHEVCELPVAVETDRKTKKASPFAALDVLKKH